MRRASIALMILVMSCAETHPSVSTNTATADASSTASTPSTASSVEVVVDDISERIKPPSPEEVAALARVGKSLQDSIAGAQKALGAKQGSKAKVQLAEARKALAEIKKHRPSVEITRHIWDTLGKVSERTESTTAPAELVPIVRKLKETPAFIADPDAAAELTVDTKLPLELVDAVVLYSEMDLPLAATELDVAAAEGFIAEGKLGRAQDVLKEVEATLSPTLFEADAPIVSARRAAVAARVELGEGNLDAVRRHLNAASAALAEAKGSDRKPSESLKSAYASLAKEIDSLKGSVKAGSKAHNLTLARIVEGLAALARFQSIRVTTANSVESERSHVMMALLDMELSRSVGHLVPSSRKEYLEAARLHLEAAAKKADSATKPLVDFSRAQLAKLEVSQDLGEQKRLAANVTMVLRDLAYQLRPREKLAPDEASEK